MKEIEFLSSFNPVSPGLAVEPEQQRNVGFPLWDPQKKPLESLCPSEEQWEIYPASALLRETRALVMEETELLGAESESHDLEKVRFHCGEAVKSEMWRPPMGGPRTDRDSRPRAQSIARVVSLALSLKSH